MKQSGLNWLRFGPADANVAHTFLFGPRGGPSLLLLCRQEGGPGGPASREEAASPVFKVDPLLDVRIIMAALERAGETGLVTPAYPAADWDRMVALGMIEPHVASWQAARERVRLAAEEGARRGIRVHVVEVGLDEMLDRLSRQGLANTPQNRARVAMEKWREQGGTP